MSNAGEPLVINCYNQEGDGYIYLSALGYNNINNYFTNQQRGPTW